MKLRKLTGDFSVCKLTSADTVDFKKPFTFLSVTDDEISLMCETASIPGNTTDIEHGWKGLKIPGMLDFSMIGIIARISAILAEEKISIFVISTYNTDYVFLKEQDYEKGISLLMSKGYEIE